MRRHHSLRVPEKSQIDRFLGHLHPHRRGGLAEKLVLTYFILQGYRPLSRARHNPVQIDLLLGRRDEILLVEVKYRRHAVYQGMPISPDQQLRLSRASRQLTGLYPFSTIRLILTVVTPRWPFVTVHALDAAE